MLEQQCAFNKAYAHLRVNRYDVVEEMMTQGFDINSTHPNGQNLLIKLFYTDFKAKEKAIFQLLEWGIDVNHVDARNQTALYYAAVANLETVFQKLIEKSADPALGNDILLHILGKDKTTIRTNLQQSPLLTEQQKEWLLKNKESEPKLLPTHLKHATVSTISPFIFNSKFGYVQNVWQTHVLFYVHENCFWLSLVRQNNRWIPYELAHKYNEKSSYIYCPYCKKQNPSSVNCKEALPFLDELFEEIVKQSGDYFS